MYKTVFQASLVFALLLAVSDTTLANIITSPTDDIFGIWDTVVGGNSTASTESPGRGREGTGQYPGLEPPVAAIDGNVDTKYLNFGNGGGRTVVADKGVGTGFYVIPACGSSLLQDIRIATGNDGPRRDPLTVSIEGSTATGTDLALGSSWILIDTVNLGIDTDPGRKTYGPVISITNSIAYTSYRVIVQSQRGVADAVQYSEIELSATPEPATMGLLALGTMFIRRKR